jgi:RNA polymerase sigma-70 factor (ECF subfamily)
MMASCSLAPAFPLTERPAPARFLIDAEAAFRDALLESFEGLALCDRNMLRFHYFHGLGVDQLAELCCSHRPAVVRQLARIRERMLRDARRGLAARLPLDRHQLDRLLEVARGRFDLAITRILRA